jgi:hypothetical protein
MAAMNSRTGGLAVSPERSRRILTEEFRFAVAEQSLSELVHKCDPAAH